MSDVTAMIGASVFDGQRRHEKAALLLRGPDSLGVVDEINIPSGATRFELDGGVLVPGFVDLQVNGGGGVQFNTEPTAEGIATICRAHRRFGTTSLLPTLITDKTEITRSAVAAGVEAARRSVPGFVGLHLEGPHLSVAKKGAHDPALIRAMTREDLEHVVSASSVLPHLMMTVAPETVSNASIQVLAENGITVSLGHSAASMAMAHDAVDAGASCVTHLFNAMSPFDHREPGLVGAALEEGALSAGIIADGIHVDPAAMAIALRAKAGPGKIFLITDAMATLGTEATAFTLNGRTIKRKNGRLTLGDGTLAGADLDMISAVRIMSETVGVGLDEALRMASLYPAQVIGADRRLGHLGPGAAANIVHLDDSFHVQRVWIGGQPVHTGP